MSLTRFRGVVADLVRLAEPDAYACRNISSSSLCAAYRRLQDPADRPVEPAEPQPDLVRQFLSEQTMSQGEKAKQALNSMTREFQRFDGDTGSSEVQAARLTTKISFMAEHMAQHHKDFHSRRGLQTMLTRRRRLLQYLRRTNFDRYSALIVRLGLRDNYAKQDRLSRRYAQQ